MCLADCLPRTLLNASLALRGGKLWHAELYGSNLGNELYVAGKTANIQYRAAPRQFGVRVGADFLSQGNRREIHRMCKAAQPVTLAAGGGLRTAG